MSFRNYGRYIMFPDAAGTELLRELRLEGESGGRAQGPGNGVFMGRAWAMRPRLLCSAGEPLEVPRLHPCARLEGRRRKGAG
eukprot:4428937-Pyramimonas_sp.AAC.1